jgi:hypothetical protein
MQYNVLENAICEANTTVGDITVSYNDLTSIVNYSSTSVKDITTSGTLVLDFDLGLRLHVDRIEYKFEASSTASGTVASGIQFGYKNETGDSIYDSLQTLVSGGHVYYSSFSGTSFAPRYIRLTHTFTTITGSIYGIRVLNNDSVVDFGTTGSDTGKSLEIIKDNSANINEVPIYNNGSSIADAYINIEPTYTDMDQALYISLSTDGPWITPIDTDNNVADGDTWDYGELFQAEANSAGDLEIIGFEDVDGDYTTKYEYALYESPIFQKDVDDNIRIIVNRDSADEGYIRVSENDTSSTIYVRSSNTPPKAYSVYREMYLWYASYIHYVSFKDTWLETGNVKYTSSTAFLSTDRYKDFTRFSCVFDVNTGRWAGYIIADSDSSSTESETWLFNNLEETSSATYLISQNSSNGVEQNFDCKDIKIDSLGGMWIHLYSEGYNDTDWCDETGYYLAYFDSSFTEKFKWYEATERVGNIAVDYTNNYLWYTNPISESILKITTEGETLVDYQSDTHSQFLGGIDVFPDGSIIYSNAGSLYRLKSNGAENEDYDIEDISDDDITYLVLDGDGSEAVWICTGNSVSRVYISGSSYGTVDFSVNISDSVRAVSVYGGLWVTCFNSEVSSSTNMYYISKENRRIEYSKTVSAGSPGLNEVGITDKKYVSYLPIAIDDVWKNLSWQKVSLENYLSSEDLYHQIRLVLRPQRPVDRYTFVSEDVGFVSQDDFNQTSVIPKRHLWGTWLDCPATDRIYVDTDNSELILDEPSSGTTDAYIQTSDRLVTSMDSDDKLEVRVKYRFGDGNTGAETGVAEYIYLYGYAVDSLNDGEYIGAYLYIHPNPGSNTSIVYAGVNGSWSSQNITNNLNLYEGTLRIYGDSNDRLYGQMAEGSSTSFVGTYRSGWQSAGEKWYWKIVVDGGSSKLQIESFEVVLGENYFYTETPSIEGIYTQELLKLENISPQSSKSMYLKVQVPSTLSVSSSCEADIKVRWRVPDY